MACARLAERLEEWQAAQQRWERARDRFPDLYAGYQGLAALHRHRGELSAAKAVLLAAAARMTDEVLTHDLARLAEASNNWAEAERWWRHFIAMRGDISWAYRGLAVALIKTGRHSEAAALFDEQLPRFPGDADFYAEQAYHAEATEDWHVAVVRWTAIADRFPDRWQAHDRIAQCLQRQGRHAEAAELLAVATSRFPAVAHLVHAHVACLRGLQRQSDAITVLESTLARFADEPAARADLERLLAELRGVAPAEDPLVRAIALSEGGEIEAASNLLDTLLADPRPEHRLIETVLHVGRLRGSCGWLAGHWRLLRALSVQSDFDLHWPALTAFSVFHEDPEAGIFLSWMFDATAPLDSGTVPSAARCIRLLLTPGEFAHATTSAKAFVRRALEICPDTERGILLRLAGGFSVTDTEFLRLLQRSIICTLNDGNRSLLLSLFDYWARSESRMQMVSDMIDVYSSVVHADAGHDPELRYLMLLCADLSGTDCMSRLVAALKDHPDRSLEMPDLSTPGGVVAKIVRDYVPDWDGSPPLPAYVARTTKLRVCLCISGQMRGYKVAFPTIGALGLGDHDVEIFVHTWEDIGRNLPQHVYSTARTFSGEFLSAYDQFLGRRGWGFVAEKFPNLIALLTQSAQVTQEQLADFFGTPHVVVDNESAADFAGKSNQWKMYYKISSCHALARTVRPDADLYIRTRPDRDFSDGQPLDWHHIHHRAVVKKVLTTDMPRMGTGGLWSGDQFAAGTSAVMDAYANAFNMPTLAAAGRLWGVPTEHIAHETVAYATLYSGLRTETPHGLGSGRLITAEAPAVADILAAIRCDIACRLPCEADAPFLAALEADLAATDRGRA